jgi:hypothetical protein
MSRILLKLLTTAFTDGIYPARPVIVAPSSRPGRPLDNVVASW